MCRGGKYNGAKGHQTTNLVDIFTVSSGGNKVIMRTLQVRGVELEFQVDTGATLSILSQTQWNKLGQPALVKALAQPTHYDGTPLSTLGQLTTSVTTEKGMRNVTFLVVCSEKAYGLMGRDIIDQEATIIETLSADTEYLPCIQGVKAGIKLNDSAKTMRFFKARNVALHIRPHIEAELDSLQRQGIISPIDQARHAGPVVWVKSQTASTVCASTLKPP